MSITINGSTGILLPNGGDSLVWFEEGAFTPIIAGETTAGTGTYSGQSGAYARVGNLFHFHLYVGWTAHTGTGNLQIKGFPAILTGASSAAGTCTMMANNYTYTASASLQAYWRHSTGSLEIWSSNTGVAWTRGALDTSAELFITGTLFITS